MNKDHRDQLTSNHNIDAVAEIEKALEEKAPLALYAYFGLLDLHTADIPGHSLYQLGLLDSVKRSLCRVCTEFDFISYLPDDVQNEHNITDANFSPGTELGRVFITYQHDLINEYCLNFEEVEHNIINKKYQKIFLKARFRNLSTLRKKWKDALLFETLINTALAAGYKPDQIIILDTDLSLPKSFYDTYKGLVEIVIPSIHFPGISKEFLHSCREAHKKEYKKYNSTVFYGNIDTSSYKEGNQKSPILLDALHALNAQYNTVEPKPTEKLVIIGKESDSSIISGEVIKCVPRFDRKRIFSILEDSAVMLNITKDKYDERHFIPARIYEALIFGMIPVSYNFKWLSPTFSFNNITDLLEIIKYLRSLEDPKDLYKAYELFVQDYLAYSDRDHE